MLSLHFFTSHDYVYVADVECQVMFSLVTLYCFMYNIALVLRAVVLVLSTEKRAFSVSGAS